MHGRTAGVENQRPGHEPRTGEQSSGSPGLHAAPDSSRKNPNLCNNKHLTRRHFRLLLFAPGDGGMVGATAVLKLIASTPGHGLGGGSSGLRTPAGQPRGEADFGQQQGKGL